MTCPICDGRGCDACDGGDFQPGCPHLFVNDVLDVVEMAAMSAEGMLPIAGGIVDQSAWFMRFRALLATEANHILEERWERDSGK